MLGENFLEQVGAIIPERWAASARNGGRHHLGMVGGFSPESAADISSTRDRNSRYFAGTIKYVGYFAMKTLISTNIAIKYSANEILDGEGIEIARMIKAEVPTADVKYFFGYKYERN